MAGSLNRVGMGGALALLLACHEPAHHAPAQTPIAPSIARTAPGDVRIEGELARRVDALAASAPCHSVDSRGELANLPCIEGPAIGEAGTPSKVFADSRLVVESASRAQLLALLTHPSVIVRAYVALWVAEKLPRDVGRLAPLLADETRVMTLDGCIGRERTLALVVVNALGGDEAEDEAHTVLLHAANDAHLPNEVRAAVAKTLGAAKLPGAHEVLGQMLGDKDPHVRRAAARSYCTGASADPKIVRALLVDPDDDVVESAANGLAERGDTSALALLEPSLMQPACTRAPRAPKPCATLSTMEILVSEESAARILLARKLVGSRYEMVRAAAIQYLARTKDQRNGTAPQARP